MIEFIKSFEFNSTLALFVYWIPVVICFCVYFFRSIGMYKEDLKRCHERYYNPELTIGQIVMFLLCALVPCVNLFALVFDCASSVFRWLGRFFDIPLVPRRPSE